MKTFKVKNINTPKYWDTHQTAVDFGLRQRIYDKLAGKGEAIIELGCGLSPFLREARFKRKIGIDFSRKTLRKAQELYPNVLYMLSDCTKTDFDDKEFDVSVAGEVIEHLENPKKLIQEMVRITKKKIIISTPQLEFEDPEHLWEFDARDLQAMLKDYGKVNIKTVKSNRFQGRKYIFATCLLEK